MPTRYVEFVTSPGTYEADTFTLTGSHTIDTSGEDFSADKGKIYNQTSARRSVRHPIKGPHKFTGSINIPIYTLGGFTLLYYALGASATVVDMTQAGSDTHTFTPGTTIPSFLLAVGRDVKEHQYVGCVMNSMSIDIIPDDSVNASFDVVARKELPTATIQTPTYPDFDIAERAFGGVEMAALIGAAEAAGAATTLIESISISVENSFQADAFSVGSEFLQKNIVAEHAVTGSLDLRFDDTTEYDIFIADTQRMVKFTGNRDAGSAPERGLDIELTRISYDTDNLPTENVQRYVEGLEFTSLADVANGDNIIIEVITEEDEATLIA